jgi:hypothetical protein
MITQVEYSVAGRSADQVTLCVVCTVHEEAMSTYFLVQLHNQGRRFDLKISRTVFSNLSSKSMATIFSGLTSKSVATIFSDLASKPVSMISPDLASKRVVDFLVEPQNQGGGRFFGLGLKTDSYGKPVDKVW